jgi:BirA family biotin operon repressor/biotin-[acetyl-CoA-carboxylase] ligase
VIEPTREDFARALEGAPLVKRLEWHEEIDSTQTRAAATSESGLLVVARSQSRGRGRYGHAWSSPPGGLWFSLVLAPSWQDRGTLLAGRCLTVLPIVISLAARAAIARVSGLETRLKWPNDILAGRRKLGGVIANVSGRAVDLLTIGVGIDGNVRRADLPADVADIATSIVEETGRDVALPTLLRAILEEVDRRIATWRPGGGPVIDEARQAMIVEQPVRWRPSAAAPWLTARILELESTGQIRLDNGDHVGHGDLEILWPT